MEMFTLIKSKELNVLLNPDFIVSVEQTHFSTKVTYFYPNPPYITIKTYDEISQIEDKIAPIKMLKLQMEEKEHELLINPKFIIIVERRADFDKTEIITSCLNHDSRPMSFLVPQSVELIQEQLAKI